MSDPIRSAKIEALREAGFDFQRAASAGIEPVLNYAAARLLYARADRIEQGTPVGGFLPITRLPESHVSEGGDR